jgi:glycosyltransferase involved in cell wall biosynthesis
MIAERLRVDATEIIPIEPQFPDATKRVLKNIFYFLRYFLRIRPSIIHFGLPWPTRDIWCGMLAAVLLRIPFLVDFQLVPPVIQYPPNRKGALKHLRKILTFAFGQADSLICVSAGNKGRLTRLFELREDRILVIHNGVYVERFERPNRQRVEELKKELGIRPNHTVVTAVARLNIQKGYEHLINAARQLVMDSERFFFLAVGDGQLRQSLESLAETMGLKEKFVFTGYRKEIPEILSLTDIFVLPTLFEGLPHAVLEAMAAGRCVVASRVDGVEEVVRHGETGILVEAGNVNELAESLRWLAARKEEREEMGRRGKERVKGLFAIDRMLGQTQKLYESILAA